MLKDTICLMRSCHHQSKVATSEKHIASNFGTEKCGLTMHSGQKFPFQVSLYEFHEFEIDFEFFSSNRSYIGQNLCQFTKFFFGKKVDNFLVKLKLLTVTKGKTAAFSRILNQLKNRMVWTKSDF